MFRTGEAAVGNLSDIQADGTLDIVGFGQKVLGKFRDVAGGDADGILHHQHLTIGVSLPAPMPMTGMRSALLMRGWPGRRVHIRAPASGSRRPAGRGHDDRSRRPAVHRGPEYESPRTHARIAASGSRCPQTGTPLRCNWCTVSASHSPSIHHAGTGSHQLGGIVASGVRVGIAHE